MAVVIGVAHTAHATPPHLVKFFWAEKFFLYIGTVGSGHSAKFC
jgi:hypothetical protein